MVQVSSWKTLIEHVGPYLKSAQPLEAMKAAGFTFTGEVGNAIAKAKPKPLDAATAARLEQALQAAPPIRMSVGVPPAPPVSRVVVGGSRIQAVVSLDTLNAVVAALFGIGSIPNELDAGDTAALLALSDLQAYCTNVPPSGSIGQLTLLSAPVLTASTNIGCLHVSFPISVPVGTSTLDATVDAEIQMVFTPLPPTQHIHPPRPPHKGIASTPAELQVSSGTIEVTLTPTAESPIQGKSPSDLAQLSSLVTAKVTVALAVYQSAHGKPLGFTVPDELTPGDFPKTHFWLTPVAATTFPGAVSRAGGTKSSLILGANANVDHDSSSIHISDLASVTMPMLPDDARLTIDESLVNDALSALVADGDLNAYLKTQSPSLTLTVDRASASFRDGFISLSLHIVAHDLCEGIDVGVTVSVSGRPTIANNTITIDAPIDVHIDASSMAECLLVAIGTLLLASIIFTLPVVISALTAALAYGIAYLEAHPLNPTVSFPATYTFGPLAVPAIDPTTGALVEGVDKVVAFTARTATADNGTLTLDGTCELIPDPNIYLYLKIVDQNGAPIKHAKVSITELDSPQPAHDDVAPATGRTITTAGGVTTTVTTSFLPSPDQPLTTSDGTLATDTSPTDANGVVLFIVDPTTMNHIAGRLTTTTLEVDLHTLHTTSASRTTDLNEGKPDFGIDVTDSAGRVLAKRRLVALNVAGTRVGSLAAPIVVPV